MQSAPCRNCLVMLGSSGNDRQIGGGGVGGSSDWAILTGQGNTSFDNWVSAVNQQVARAAASANFVNELNNFANAIQNNSIRTLVNNNDGSWQMTGANNVISASIKNDENGNMTLTHNYSDPTAGVPEGKASKSILTLCMER